MKFKLRPVHGSTWFHDNISCHAACPVGTEAFAYVQALAEQDRDIGLYNRPQAESLSATFAAGSAAILVSRRAGGGPSMRPISIRGPWTRTPPTKPRSAARP